MISEGTRSYLIGCHQFFLHPLFVLLAWKLEYHSRPKWWEIICIFLHDIGICQRQYLSNDKAKVGHWEQGAKLVCRIVGTIIDDSRYWVWNRKKDPWEMPFWMQAYLLCAGHCPEESGFPESKLSRADKRSWLVAPMWWLWWNYWVEWHGKDFGTTLYDATAGWKRQVAENLRSENPTGSHELYLRNRRKNR